MTSLSKLHNLATGVRQFLEPHWKIWHATHDVNPCILSQGTCGRSSLFLQQVLRSNGFDAAWITGCPFDFQNNPIAAGFKLNDIWHGHSWIKISSFIVDITSDQFGLPPVSILPIDDQRFRSSGDFSSDNAKLRRKETAEKLWQMWSAN